MGPLGAIGYLLIGCELLREAFSAPKPVAGTSAPRGRNGLPPMSGKLVRSATIDDRVKRIAKLTREAGREPKVRQAALRVLTRRCGPPSKPFLPPDPFNPLVPPNSTSKTAKGSFWCIGEKDWRAEAEALFSYCRDQVRYTRDPAKHDTYVAGVRTLFDWHGGDCDDMTIALGGLLLSVGFDVDLIVVQTTGNSSWNHIYLAAIMPDGKSFMALDPSMDKPAGWEVPRSMVLKRKVVRV